MTVLGSARNWFAANNPIARNTKALPINPAIRVAIICEPETTVPADSLETLLADARGVTTSRFEYRADAGLKPDVARFGDPDVVLATLGSFGATNFEVFFSALQCAFPHRSVVVAMPHTDAFDIFPMLE